MEDETLLEANDSESYEPETPPRVMSMCKLRPELVEGYRPAGFEAEDRFIYMGEIVNMLGHGVFILQYFVGPHTKYKFAGKVYSGYHIESFVELTEEEM